MSCHDGPKSLRIRDIRTLTGAGTRRLARLRAARSTTKPPTTQHHRAQAEQHRRRVMLLAVRCLVDHVDHASYMSRPPLTAQICPVM